MANLDIKALDRRMKWGLLLASLATLVLLVASALQENVFPEWRTLRLQYAKLLQEKATNEREQTIADQFEIGMDHNVLPELNTIDRCITCHTGLDDPRMTDEPNPFRTHPGTFVQDHPSEQFGCTVCHQGQGRATEVQAAHGRAPHWDYPMLEPQFLYSSCGQCHDDTSLYDEGLMLAADKDEETPDGARLMAEGKRLVEDSGCLGCHVLRGKGGILGPDITFVGDKTRHDLDFSHFAHDEPREVPYWLMKHFLEPTQVSPDTTMPDMGLNQEEAEALTAYVLSLRDREMPASHRPVPPVDRPLPAEPTGAELYTLLCSSCHGHDGAASEVPGIRTPALNNRDSLAVAGDDYYRHIIAEGRSGTNMPGWGPRTGNLTQGQIDAIVTHLRGWSGAGAPVEDVSARRGDAAMGRAYYQGLCMNCHGYDGAGGIGNTLNSPTFLAIASDQFLAESIVHGRPGTAMASWKHLSSQAVSDILAYMRSWQSDAPDFAEVRGRMHAYPQAEQARVGRALYQGNCAGCHGAEGEGGIGLLLNSQDVIGAVSDEYLFESITEGRPTTAMPAWRHLTADQVAAIIVYMRSWETGRRPWLRRAPQTGDYALGEVHYAVSCAGCHGEEGRGGVGPQLANRAFMNAVSGDLLYHWISRGRAGTAMKGFLTAEQGPTSLSPNQIADVMAYLRYLAAQDTRPILRTGVGNASLGGQLYEGSCAGCHGFEGEGASGPQLNNPAFLRTASDGFLAATIALGRVGTPMQSMIHGHEGLGQLARENVQDVIAYLRLWDYPRTWHKPRAVAEMSQRAIMSGQTGFAQFCAGCHGPNGQGVKDGEQFFAPALNNPEFLDAASDGFLLATIARGRSNTPMRPFGNGTGGIAALDASEISDIVSYIRTWQESYAPQGES